MSDRKNAPEKELNDSEQAKKNKDEWKLENRVKTLHFVNIFVLMAVFAVITVFMTFGKRPNVSYVENRDLEKPPVFTWEDYWAGKVTDQFSKYYNDTVPMRSTWKLFISNFRDHLGIKYKGGITIVGDMPVIEQPTKPDVSSSRPPNSVPDVVIPGTGGTSSGNKVPGVVIPGTGSSSTSSGNKVPDVYIPPKPSDSSGNTHEPTSE